MRFDPAGFTNNSEIPIAKSITDYVFRYLGMKFLSSEEKEEIFGPELRAKTPEIVEEAKASLADLVVAENAAKSKEEEISAQAILNLPVAHNADAPVCHCGTLMVRAGSCYSCPNCFATTGACN